MRRGLMSLVTAGPLVCAPATAQDDQDRAAASAERLVTSGSWRMTATKNGPDGKPECTEVWHFNADGTGWVESGAERIENTWRTGLTEGDIWLYTRSTASNGAPDCMGKASDPASFPRNVSGSLLIFFNNRDGILCQPSYTRNPDGSLKPTNMLSEENCWGRITPVAGE